jgi:hypothetical protein
MASIEEHLARMSAEVCLAYADIDLSISEAFLSWEECQIELDEREYFLLVHHLRWAYMTGFEEGKGVNK